MLATDADQVIDIRNQHGVGPDAVDELRRLYDLKLWQEPRLTSSG